MEDIVLPTKQTLRSLSHNKRINFFLHYPMHKSFNVGRNLVPTVLLVGGVI